LDDDTDLMAGVIEACQIRGELDALIEEDPDLYDDMLAACSSVSKKTSAAKSMHISDMQILAAQVSSTDLSISDSEEMA